MFKIISYNISTLSEYSKMSLLFRLTFIIFAVAMLLTPTAEAGQAGATDLSKTGDYQDPVECANCHQYLFSQFEQSMHARSYRNPIFQNQVYNVLLPQMSGDPDAMQKAGACLSCHAPTAYLTHDKSLPAQHSLGPRPPGVTCDFCHTIIGFQGTKPGNANYIPSPGPVKYGPLSFTSDWHHKYAEFQRKSGACAVCHEATNNHGVHIYSTYSEWKTSSWARKGVHCQDCHMSATGRYIADKPVYEKGAVAAGTIITPAQREKIYSHRFPGASVQSQVEGAIKLRVFSFPAGIRPGRNMFIGVELDNSEAGHSMPTGSIELRFAWLDVKLRMPGSGQEWQLQAEHDGNFSWDVAGMSSTDAELLGPEVTRGSRLYRAIVVDKKGKQTLNNWEAVSKVFDNRLKAGEVRREMFRFTLPPEASGNLEASVSLRYLRYPPGFVKSSEISPAESVLIAGVSKTIKIGR